VSSQGDYQPTPIDWVREQIEAFEASGGEINLTPRSGIRFVVVTMRGRTTGLVRKQAVIRVVHGGEYGLVASFGGAPQHPTWYHNLIANPHDVQIQDGPEPFPVHVREVFDTERSMWWARAVEAYPKYEEYRSMTDRVIPVLVASPR
jgi:F420H(2)-dependent quinone reductase